MPMRRENVAAALKYLQDKADLRGRFQRATSLDPQEQDLADIAVETGASFIPGVGPALAARDFERARRADDQAGMAMAAASAIPGERLAKLLGKFDPTRLELDVYHGTPHRFEPTEANPLGEFDASKIGTGEGAQAYGHGVYYAENPEVAKGYQSSLSADRGFSFEGKTGLTRAEVQDMVNAKYGKGYLDNILRPSGVADSFIDDMVTGVSRPEGAYPKQYKPGSERAKLYDELRGKITHASPGSLYKADLPDEMIDRMLDWDKPLSKDAPQAVKDAFNKLAKDYPELKDKLFAAYREGKPGSHYYSLLNDYAKTGDLVKNQSFASDALRQAGIPGIKYLDAGSRGQGGSGTRNFVVFPGEEKKVRILERK